MKIKKVSLIILKFLVSGGLLYAIMSKTGLDKVGSTLQSINPLYFLAATLSYIFSILLSSKRLQFLLPDGFRVKRLFSLYLIGAFFNNILPGIIGGDAIKAYYLYKDTGKSSTAVASVFMDRYVGFAAMMCLGLAAYPFGLVYFRGSYIEWALPVIAFLFFGGSSFFFWLRIGGRFAFLSEMYDYLHMYRNRREAVVKTFLISLAVQAINVWAAYVISLGLHLEIPLLPFFIFIPIISTLATIPVSISGLGVREASFVLLFGFLGVDAVHATALSFAWFLSAAVGSLPGLVEYLRHKKSPQPKPEGR